MSNLKEKYRNLVRRLYDKTTMGQIDWDVDRNDEIYCSLSNYDVHLKSSRDADGEPLEIVELRNKDNQPVDSFDDVFINEVIFDVPGVDNYYQMMQFVRSAARRKAMGADKALEEVLKDLEDDFGL